MVNRYRVRSRSKTMGTTVEISDNVLESVRKLCSESFDKGKHRDVQMSFDIDEGGELCIRVSLFFDPSTTIEDFERWRLTNFLFNVSEICSEEYGNVLPWLDFQEAKELA